MTDIPDTYEPEHAEPTWRASWRDSDLYSAGAEPDYVIDTPPPYPTGNLHIGNALGWCYMDFAARFRRLVGDDVAFPQGWDCHGLPTEVKVEEEQDIHRSDVSREEFRELCVAHTEQRIDDMKETMRLLGFSHDWDLEFRTMDPEYWGLTQESFLAMADDGYVFQDEFPVNWCPRCETAIADAEVETAEGVEGTLYEVAFQGVEADAIEIATTRPELLAACVAVAVHPEDDRHADRVGDTVEVPLFGQAVDVLADEAVDQTFGTGAVMICTFGDKQDVEWWTEYDLDRRDVFTADGRLSGAAGEYAGLPIDEATTAIVEDLDAAGHLGGSEPTTQSVGECWRCDTPIEILATEQWFLEVRQDEILETAQGADWIPDHMYDRLVDWTEGMNWDWVISRQRVFATPIPAWHCDADGCDYTHLADRDACPVDPTDQDPAVDECPECGGDAWTGETDVMDTWMDSSITPLYLRDWPDADFEPTSLRPQGHDIIRTWAFYTLLRVGAIADAPPWEEVLINGMVFGDDGHKMSKSRGNFVQPEAVVEEYSADAFRQAMALGGQPGSDIQFQWKEVKSAARFGTKVWNITRFAADHLDAEREPLADPAYRDVDRWIRSRATQVAETVREDMAAYRYASALRTLREFVWHDLADDYLELCKGRLYDGRPGERDAARQALGQAVSASLRMLSPFAPFLAEEAWDAIPSTEGSVHAADWPTLDAADAEADRLGAIITDVAATVRAWKSEAGMALNADLEKVEVYPEDLPEAPVDTYDLSEAVNGPVMVRTGVPSVDLVPVAVEIDHSVLGPEFRDRAGAVAGAIEALDPAEVASRARGREAFEVALPDGEAVDVPAEAVEVVEEHRASSGDEVAVLQGECGPIIVYP